MTDADSLRDALKPLVPLRIRAVEHEDPSLVVIGDGWSLALIGAWASRRGDAVVTEWGESATPDVAWELCGLDLLAVRCANPSGTGDCAFDLSDGGFLEARSDDSGYDTWTFSHEALAVVFVGQ